MATALFGAGSLGSLLGGLLARARDMMSIGREPHIGAIRTDGLRISGEIREISRPSAKRRPDLWTAYVLYKELRGIKS